MNKKTEKGKRGSDDFGKSQRVFLLMAVIFSLNYGGARATFESFPEFFSLQENEVDTIEGPGGLGSEYQSHLVTYNKEPDWTYSFFRSQRSLDTSWGSISPSHFQINDRLRLRKSLASWSEFRFTAFSHQDREIDQKHTIFEVLFLLPKNWAFSFYGEPALYKRRNDVGLALLYLPNSFSEIRFFYTFVDVTRIKRNDDTDTFDRGYVPVVYGLSAKIFPERDDKQYFMFSVRQESKTKWLFPDDSLEYTFYRRSASLESYAPLSEDNFLRLQLLVDGKFEEKIKTDGSDLLPQSSRKSRRLLMTWEDYHFFEQSRLKLGANYSYRRWNDIFRSVAYRDYLVFFWWKMQLGTVFSKPTYGDFGYQVAWHREKGDLDLRKGQEKDGKVEHKFNFKWTTEFSKTAIVNLLFTFDLDRFGSSESWEGGNAQFQFLF